MSYGREISNTDRPCNLIVRVVGGGWIFLTKTGSEKGGYAGSGMDKERQKGKRCSFSFSRRKPSVKRGETLKRSYGEKKKMRKEQGNLLPR